MKQNAAIDKMALRSILLPYPPYPLVGRERSRPNGRLQCFWQLSHPFCSVTRVNPHSRHFPTLPVNRVKVVSVSLRFISVNLKYFGNKSSPRLALNLNDCIEGICDVGLYGPVGYPHAALQHATCKP